MSIAVSSLRAMVRVCVIHTTKNAILEVHRLEIHVNFIGCSEAVGTALDIGTRGYDWLKGLV